MEVLGSMWLPLAFVTGFVLLVFVLPLYLLANHLRKRTRQMETAAGQLGFSFTGDDDSALKTAFAKLQLFRTGDTVHLRNILQKENASGFTALLDLNWVSSSLKQTEGNRSSSTHNQTVACFRVAGLSLPEFVLKPERFIDKLLVTKIGGFEDIDIEGHPAFSKAYLLYGDSPDRIRELFATPGLIDFCMTEKNICIEGAKDVFIVYRHMKVVPAASLSHFISRAEQVKTLLLTQA